MNNWNTASCSMEHIQEISYKLSMRTNGLVMTRATLSKLRQVVGDNAPIKPYDFYHGMPVWVYDTVKGCMDRMMDQSKGERLQLVLDEGIPADCLFHPWIKQQVEHTSDKKGFSIRGYE